MKVLQKLADVALCFAIGVGLAWWLMAWSVQP